MSNLNNVTSSQIWMFFFFIFSVICCSTCFSDLCSSRIPELQMLWIILFAMVMTLIIYLVWWFCIYYPYDTNILPTCPAISASPSTANDLKENFADVGGAVSRNRPASDTAVNRNQGIGFHFQVTPPKFCYNGGGDYVKPPTKEQQEYCKNLMSTEEGRNLYYDYNCTPGFFNGRPLNMEPRTPESNAYWENTMCDSPILADNPKVL